MTALRRHVIAVVAALFALAVGIALGGGPLSYVETDDVTPANDRVLADSSQDPVDEPAGQLEFAQAFAGAAAPALYDAQLLGHPTAIVAMPGVDRDLVATMSSHITAAGGGLTGVFAISPEALDRDETTMVDTLTAQLMVQLGDVRIDSLATTYARLGQLLSVALATPVQGGQRASVSAETIRTSLGTAGLLTASPTARLAPLVLVLLPQDHDLAVDEVRSLTAIYSELVTGLRANAAGVVLLGDTGSGDDGLLAGLRGEPEVTSAVASVDGGDTVVGQVTALLAVIAALEGSVGAFGASGSDGVVPLS